MLATSEPPALRLDILAPMYRTEKDSARSGRVDDPSGPGLVIVWSGKESTLVAHRVGGEGLTLGRELAGTSASDDRISRQHARVRLADGAFVVTDLESRNGTSVAGQRIERETWAHPPAVVRTGRTVSLLVRDVRRFEGAQVTVTDGVVVGPTLADAWARIERAARGGDSLLLTGESGTGKELAARKFHAATGARGEMIAVNCAAIPAGVAERLLFGTRRGAYSGADRDADGYLAAADGGTIFFDEIGELDLAVQAKLLRVLETREVLPLGAAKPRKIEVRVVAATLRDLRTEVAERRFREDLYHRVGRPEVRLAPLRERLEDLSWLVATTIEHVATGLAAHPALIETCLLRPWPGNARELVGEVRRAALAAREAGRTDVRVEDLDPHAGLIIQRATASDSSPSPAPSTDKPAPLPDRAAILRALEAEGGNVTRAARNLGLHRNQLRRFLARQPELAPKLTGED